MQTLFEDFRTTVAVQSRLNRITARHLNRAQGDWQQGFYLRSRAGLCDGDALLWECGFMSPHAAVCEPSLPGYVLLDHEMSHRIEGIVVFDSSPGMSRGERKEPLIYVRYLATAPWNRPPRCRLRGRNGVGRVLVRCAVLESLCLGLCGRVGLHALPGARQFYDHLGFDFVGMDPLNRGLSVYELQPDIARRILADPSPTGLTGVSGDERTLSRTHAPWA